MVSYDTPVLLLLYSPDVANRDGPASDIRSVGEEPDLPNHRGSLSDPAVG